MHCGQAVTLICSVGVIGPLWAPFNTPLYVASSPLRPPASRYLNQLGTTCHSYRRTRVVIYSGMGLSSLVPLFHLPFVFPASTILPIIVLVYFLVLPAEKAAKGMANMVWS